MAAILRLSALSPSTEPGMAMTVHDLFLLIPPSRDGVNPEIQVIF
jgi:hypothetical protein